MTIIEGVLANEPGGAMGSDKIWHLVVSLAPWRHPDGHIENKELRVEQAVGTNAKVERGMARLSKGTTVRVSTSRVTPPRPGFRWWSCTLATRIAKAPPVRDLEDARRDLARPVVVRDPVLGRLVLDRELHWFVGRRTLARKRYELTLDQALEGDDAVHVRALRPRVLAFEARLPRIVDRLAGWMFKLYNGTWRDEDQPALTRTELARRLRLTSVQVGQSDRTTAYFHVGDLFGDHAVVARLGPRASIREILLG